MLKMKNWSSYQSYKDRRPPWIRLHKSLLDNFEYLTMSLAGRSTLPLLWLLASEDENPVTGLIRICNKKISFRLRLPISEITEGINECIKNGFVEEVQEVTDSYTNGYENVTPEERRGENRDRVETENKNGILKFGVNGNGKQKPITGSSEGDRIAAKFATLAAE